MGNKITRKCLSIDERYTKLQGLYPQRNVDKKKLRRLILNSKLAPCFPGEEEANADFEECPICFLYYPSLNRSKCCSKGVCTECFLQMKSLRSARSIQCPFCKFHNYAVGYRGSKTLEEKGIEAAEEQRFIEAKIRMRKREFLSSEAHEGLIQPDEAFDGGHGHASGAFQGELPEPQSHPAVIHVERPQQVTFTFDIEKWAQNLCEPHYCYGQQWVRKPCGPSLSAGPSSFRTCGSHCEPSCAKCLLTFHKRRVHDAWDVTTPRPRSLETNPAEPLVGRWRSTWGSHQSPLSRSFPLPTRRPPECRYRRLETCEPPTIEPHPHDAQTNCDGMFVCVEDPKRPNAHDLTQEYVLASSMSPTNLYGSSMDSSWICEEYGSEGSLVPTPTVHQDERSTTPLLSNNKTFNDNESTILKHEGRSTPTDNTQQSGLDRDDEFDLDLEEIMVMEAIWQSIQDQQVHIGDTTCKLPQMKTNQHVGVNTTFQVNNDIQDKSKLQCQHVGLIGNDQHPCLNNRKIRRLASAIAALAERQAIKKETIFKPPECNKEISLHENEPSNNDKIGELQGELRNVANVIDDYKIESKDLIYRNCDKKNLFGESGLYALAHGLITYPTRKNCLETLTSEDVQSEVFLRVCQNDQGIEQVEDGASSSTLSACSDNAVYVPHISSQNVRVNKCRCDTNREVMLPKSFEEQIILAIALSITDAH